MYFSSTSSYYHFYYFFFWFCVNICVIWQAHQCNKSYFSFNNCNGCQKIAVQHSFQARNFILSLTSYSYVCILRFGSVHFILLLAIFRRNVCECCNVFQGFLFLSVYMCAYGRISLAGLYIISRILTDKE